jgi:hypothetical protein
LWTDWSDLVPNVLQLKVVEELQSRLLKQERQLLQQRRTLELPRLPELRQLCLEGCDQRWVRRLVQCAACSKLTALHWRSGRYWDSAANMSWEFLAHLPELKQLQLEVVHPTYAAPLLIGKGPPAVLEQLLPAAPSSSMASPLAQLTQLRSNLLAAAPSFMASLWPLAPQLQQLHLRLLLSADLGLARLAWLARLALHDDSIPQFTSIAPERSSFFKERMADRTYGRQTIQVS